MQALVGVGTIGDGIDGVDGIAGTIGDGTIGVGITGDGDTILFGTEVVIMEPGVVPGVMQDLFTVIIDLIEIGTTIEL